MTPPKRFTTKLIGHMMAAFKFIREELSNPQSHKEIGKSFVFNEERTKQYVIPTTALEQFKKAFDHCLEVLDQYPKESFIQAFQKCLIHNLDNNATESAVSDDLKRLARTFFENLTAHEWCVLTAVSGIAGNHSEIQIGDCTFIWMGENESAAWQKRESAGSYYFAPDTVVYKDPIGSFAPLIDHSAVVVRLKAADAAHAKSKAKVSINEAVSILRYGTAIRPQGQFAPRVGESSPTQWRTREICVKAQPISSTNPPDSQMSGMLTYCGVDVRNCTFMPAWTELLQLASKSRDSRTEVDRIIFSALQWISQGVAAPDQTTRLVCYVTALEVLLIKSSEGNGKKSHLRSRIQAVPHPNCKFNTPIAELIDGLYETRSKCLHEGMLVPEDGDTFSAFLLAGNVIKYFLTDVDMQRLVKIADVLDRLDTLLVPPKRKNLPTSPAVRYRIAKQHLCTARNAAFLANHIEATSTFPYSENRLSEHRGYCSTAIMFSIAFVETAINELYLASLDGPSQGIVMGLSESHVGNLASAYHIVRRGTVLEKYQKALKACERPEMPENAQPVESIVKLILLRNALVHYEPEWSDEPTEHNKLRDGLNGLFPPSPFYGSTHLWFPHQCLSGGCANWALAASSDFLAHFCSLLGIKNYLA